MDKDPYKYFRIEARELLEGLTQGFLDLEKGNRSRDLISRLLRQAHTLKGAARVVKKTDISELAHAMEDVLAPCRDGDVALPGEQISRLLHLVDGCGERLKGLQPPPPEESPHPPRPEPEELFTSVRVEIAAMDGLLYDLAEAGVHLAALRQEIAALDQVMRAARTAAEPSAASGNGSTGANLDSPPLSAPSPAQEVGGGLGRLRRSLQTGLERAERDFGRVRDRASKFRLLPAGAVFAALERSVRDVAESTKKWVVFEAKGAEHRLDAHVLLALRDALIHVVRNAVAHGIETEPERQAAGKPPTGRVRLHVQRRGQRVRFRVEDDGCGLDVAAIRRVAVLRRLVTPAEAEALDLAEATRLVFQGGVSTSPDVSEVAGRGVGLDVVRATAARLKGEVSLQSEPGRGTAVEITVPVSIDSMTVLAVVADLTMVLLPFHAVGRALLATDRDLVRSGPNATLVIQDQAIPFRFLRSILGGTRPQGRGPRAHPAVVVQAGGTWAALGVDRLEGIRNVVVRPLPALCGPVRFVTGAALDGAGNPELVLDPASLVQAVRGGLESATEPAPVAPPTVLVVDDSLTTRMLEQSILEAAGYPVDLATSGEEALRKARQKRYGLFVVDVEMPGMDGFELLQQFRGDPALRDIPPILVTSRASAEDRRRGEDVGARAYIVKSEFDEVRLLQTIRELVGEVMP